MIILEIYLFVISKYYEIFKHIPEIFSYIQPTFVSILAVVVANDLFKTNCEWQGKIYVYFQEAPVKGYF
jgi:hypothetical protein